MPEAPSRKASLDHKDEADPEGRVEGCRPNMYLPAGQDSFLEERTGDADVSAACTLSVKHVQGFPVKAGFKIR